MNWTREQLKSNAKLMVKKNWVTCALVSFIVMMIAGREGGHVRFNFNLDGSNPQNMDMNQAVNGAVSNLGGEWTAWFLRFAPLIAGVIVFVVILALALSIFIGNPLRVGGCRFYLHNIHSMGEFNDLGFAFQNAFGNVVKVMLLRDIYIILWMLLLIVPGIIKSYEYRMVPFLLADNPELDAREALQISRSMMDGEKMNAFILDLSFILWEFLSAVTFGIAGYIWVNPYVDATNAELYMALSAKQTAYGGMRW